MPSLVKALLVCTALISASVGGELLLPTHRTAATAAPAAAPAAAAPAVGRTRAYCDTHDGYWQPCAEYDPDAVVTT